MVVGTLGLGSATSACQPAPVPRSDGAATSAPRAGAAPPSTPAPGGHADSRRRGGSLAWAVDAGPSSLDPHRATDEASIRAWADLTYQSLTMFDANLKVAPALAETWTHPDPTTWIFKLREGVRFHNGDELEAADVVFWFERIRAGETAAPDRPLFEAVRTVEPRDQYTVAVTLAAPHAPLLSTLAALRGSAIVPRRWAANAKLADDAVGTGPFRIEEYAPGSHMRYVRSPSYWERGLPRLDDVTLRIVPDEEARIAGLRTGEYHVTAVRPAAARQLSSDRTVQLLASAGPRQLVHRLNTQRKPFDDVRVRQAISLAVDRRAAIEQLAGGHASLTGPVPSGHGDWSLAPDRLRYPRDVGRARQLVAEAGYGGSARTTIKTALGHATLLRISTLLAEQLKEIGIEADVAQMDGASLRQTVAARDYDILAAEIPFLPDPDTSLTPPFHSRGADNTAQWSSPRFDELVDTARQTMAPAERKRLYDEAQMTLLDEAPAIWWFAEHNVEALHASVRGYVQSFTGHRGGLKRAWVER